MNSRFRRIAGGWSPTLPLLENAPNLGYFCIAGDSTRERTVQTALVWLHIWRREVLRIGELLLKAVDSAFRVDPEVIGPWT
jgi:hypothetical protein